MSGAEGNPPAGRKSDWRAGWRIRLLPPVLISLRAQLTVWYVVILALILILSSGAIYLSEQQALQSQVDSRLLTRLQQWATAYDAQSGHLAAPRDAALAQEDEVALLLTPSGQVIQTFSAGHLSAVKVPWDQAVRAFVAVAQSGTPMIIDQGLLFSTVSGISKNGQAPNTIAHAALFRITGRRVSGPGRALLVVGVRSDIEQQLATLARTLETLVPLTLILCSLGGYWLADRALRPIRAIARTAQQIGASDLSKRLNLQRRDEMGQLAATFDRMLERLEETFARQRQFTADAGHELRTPLTIVDLQATHALSRPRAPEEYRQAIRVMQHEAGHMARVIDDLLTLARTDSGEPSAARREIAVEDLVLEAVERLGAMARRNKIALVIEPLPDVWLWGDPHLLARMLINIVENALKYGEGRATRVHLSGERLRQNGVPGVVMRVADDGPGIAAEDLPHVCERFYRVDRARTHSVEMSETVDPKQGYPMGSGLGLAISQGVVGDHQGSLRVLSEPGTGTVVEIWLPEYTRQGEP